MVSETEVRRSGRRTVRPVEFWNFEKPDESRSETIIYNLNDLSKCSIYNVMSTKYIHGNKSVPVENKKTETTRSLKKRATVQDGQERQSRTLQATSNNANSNKHKTKSKKIVGKNDMTKATENKDVSVISKVSKSSKGINETEVPQEHPPKLMIKKHNEQENGSSVMSTIKSDWLPYKSSDKKKIQMLPVASLTPENSSINASQSQMKFDQPSFQNILSSTVNNDSFTSKLRNYKQVPLHKSSRVGNPDNGIFKIPSLLPYRRLKKSSMTSQLSIYSIPEECETDLSQETVSLVTTRNEFPSQTCQTNTTLQKNPPSQMILKPARLPTVRGRRKHCDKQSKETSDPGRSVVLLSNTEASTDNNDTVSIRRSGRVRTKPLEFWNFEKIEVRALENGEVDVIHHKQELPVIRKKKDKESQTSQHPAVNSNRHKACVRKSPQRLFTESSVSKRKLFSPISNSLDETANAEDSKPLKRMRRSLETKEESPVPPTIKVTQFKDLNFIETVSKRCRCYLARCFQDEEFDTYAGFAFVEWGQLVWVTTRETKLFVIEGLGTLKMTDATAKGKIVYLETRTEVAITSGKKVSVVKDGKCKILKLFIYLGSTTTTSSSSDMMSVPIQRCS
ncbi:uncharacterized protein [Procambarus clarkii]|uniref:uncharacterized protein n=1 Tax=Procambarus clarkii TaxID=6728 RepID=UPI003743D7FB